MWWARSGWPVEHQASISVLAESAAVTDVAATVLGVLPVDEALTGADDLGVGCLVIDPVGGMHTSTRWPRGAPR